MQEVQRQIGPLAEQVAKIGNNVERLYNSNGGPPGYLQTARSEDKGRFEMIFNILDEHKDGRSSQSRISSRSTKFRNRIGPTIRKSSRSAECAAAGFRAGDRHTPFIAPSMQGAR